MGDLSAPSELILFESFKSQTHLGGHRDSTCPVPCLYQSPSVQLSGYFILIKSCLTHSNLNGPLTDLISSLPPAHVCYPPRDLLYPFSNSPTSDGLVFPSPSVAVNQCGHDDGGRYHAFCPLLYTTVGQPLYYPPVLTGTTKIACIVLRNIILFPIINLF